MKVTELESGAHVRLTSVLNALVEHHDIRLNFSVATIDELLETYDACENVKIRVVESAAPNSYIHSKKYQEAALIQEAIRIYLSEVAPKRLNRRRNSNLALGANNE